MENFIKKYDLTENQFYGKEVINKDLIIDEVDLPIGFNPEINGNLIMNNVTKINHEFYPIVYKNLEMRSFHYCFKNFISVVGKDLYLSNIKQFYCLFKNVVGGFNHSLNSYNNKNSFISKNNDEVFFDYIIINENVYEFTIDGLKKIEQNFQNIEDVKNPIIGNFYKFPCLIHNNTFLPVYNHPHSDKENGQIGTHYHMDSRVLHRNKKASNNFLIFNDKKLLTLKLEIRSKEGEIVYLPLKYYDDIEYLRTDTHFIKNSKLKHNCIHKGKCPHRGYNLENVKPINGVIICPLHSLRFDEKTKKLLDKII